MSKSVTAADVRNYFRADEKRMARLDEAAQVTVRQGARGRLHPKAVATFNAKRKADRRYVEGATKRVTSEAAAAAKALRSEAAAKGLRVGKRGPLPKATLEALKG